MNFEERNPLKEWLQENLRIIVAVTILGAIAGGIYSYSNRAIPEKSIKIERKSFSAEKVVPVETLTIDELKTRICK